MPTITVLEIRDAVYAWLPNIMHISKIPNNKLIKKIEAYISQITKLHSNATITRLHSMFSMVNSAANGCMYYQDFLSYYDEQAKNLYENICQGNQTWQKKVKAKLEQSVLDISDKNVTNPSNPAFLNYIAEILYAATIIPRAQDGEYEFLGFDVSMNNGKDADLQFRRIDDGMLIYFDNLSIHGVDISKVDQSEDLYNYLKTKLDQKIASKTSGLVKENENYIINGAVSEFHVAPILWNESCDMLPHKDAFQQFENEKTVSGLFVALKPQYLSNGRFYFSIDKIKNILQHWEEQLTTIDND